ncbi:MAG: MBL fold metallo-hydrolase [Ardenticatenales bacterium]|nr:MBL fold metallo-hydrolase [Ardenticatenales bacterium]
MRVHILDLNFMALDHAVAAFAVEGPDGWALVETGPGSTLPALVEGLAALGVHPAELAGVLVTHIHLDHAGAAGWLARQGVPIHVHPVGAPHLVDPSRLIASATRIYGDAMDRLWGDILPAPADRVIAVEDGATVAVAGLTFRAIATPGHAKHHHAWRVGDALFTGDAGGVRLPGSRLVAVPAVPPEFDPDAWRATMDRLVAECDALPATTLYLTHFGAVADGRWHFERLREELSDVVAFIGARQAEGADRDAILSHYVEWSRARALEAGVDAAELARFEAANPFGVSVDGVLRWLGRRSA